MNQLTQGQLNAISIMERACSSISLLGSLFTIVTFVSLSAFRERPANRLVFYASLGNMASNAGTLMSRSFLDDLNSFGCQFQAMLIQWFIAADVGWILAMAINVYLTVYRKYDVKRLHKMELTYLPACYGIPFIPAFTYLFVRHNGQRIYGDAILWCWISSDLEILRMATVYGPVWIRKQVHELDSDYNLRSSSNSEFTTYNGTESTTRIGSDVVLSVHTRTIYHQTTAIQLAPCPQHSNSTQTLARRHSYEHKNAAWSYSKCALLYFTAILITWIPASANRVYSLVHEGQTVAPVAYMSSFVVSLQGFWNWIIYVVMSWGACKQLLQDIKDRCLRVCGKTASGTNGSGHPGIGRP